jgi:formate dehydrogenase gamma subunit
MLVAALALLLPSVGVLAQKNADCLACHSDKTMTKSGGKSLYVRESILKATSHGQLGCTDCHLGLDISKTPHAAKIQPVMCVNCHSDARSKHTAHKSQVPASGSPAQVSASCKNCHGSHMSKPLSTACGTCHPAAKAEFAANAHGKALLSGIDGAPDCFTCHRNNITSAGGGRGQADLKIAQEKICLSCHVSNPTVAGCTLPNAHFVAGFQKSVHGVALANGNGKAANCVDCHGSHSMLKGIDPKASVNRANIPATCGKCHQEIAKEYSQSIHGVALSKGNTDAPVCTTCHGEHNILSPTDPRCPVAPRNIAQQVCGTCHSSVKLSEKYGISSDRFQTFSDSYHGLAIRGGSLKAANCASCHSAHNIKPSSDPTSTVNKRNVPKTCGKCHPGANKRFAMGKVHVAVTQKQQPVLWWIGLIYVLLIVGTIGGMFAHNFLDLFKKWRRHVELHDLHGLYVRMSVFERIQHLLMMSSFIMLALTGFMLHYPDAWWVVHIRNLSTHFFALRGILHRGAAVAMVGACVIHVLYVLFTERGRQLALDMLPKRKDVTDVIGVVKYGLGAAAEKPKLGRFSYIEKSEYWALLWGSIVMTLTGIIMWADNFFIGLVTKLGWDIARTVHFYEAWLAVLAIIVWHLYFVIFNPDVYPMNAAWITGTLPEDVLAEEHALEYEAIKGKIADSKRKSRSKKKDEL